MKYYFVGAIKRDGANVNEDIINNMRDLTRINELLEEKGMLVNIRVANPSQEQDKDEEALKKQYKSDIASIEQGDVLIAELSTPSFASFYEMSYADSKGKRVIGLYKKDTNLSSKIKENKHFELIEYSDIDSLLSKLEETLGNPELELKDYDNRMVRIIDSDNNIIEGVCAYKDLETNEVLYGLKAESLVLSGTHFTKEDITMIKEIGDFSSKYGYLEETVIKEGLPLIQEVLESEENTSIYRLLLCLEDEILSFPLEEQKEIKGYLKELMKFNKDELLENNATRIIEKIGE